MSDRSVCSMLFTSARKQPLTCGNARNEQEMNTRPFTILVRTSSDLRFCTSVQAFNRPLSGPVSGARLNAPTPLRHAEGVR